MMFRRKLIQSCALALTVALLTGCHWDMWNNARLKPLEPSTFFGEGESSSRTYVAGTVPYMGARLDDHYYTGLVNGEFAGDLPSQIDLDADLLARGQERYNIYCVICHGATGEGNGMITKRGFPLPPSYHEPRLLESEIGYFFDVMTNGFGRMYSYASRIPVEDRWAIAAYIRVLQLSQNATPDIVPAQVLTDARAAIAADQAEQAAPEAGHNEGEGH